MADFQVWLVRSIAAMKLTAPIMYSKWGWPACESLHFIGLSLLVGMIGAFDLRLLGVAKRIPIAALHRFVPFGVAGFLINVVTGAMFLLTEPDQYIFNVSFHVKLLFLAMAGLNVLVFYSFVYRRVKHLPPGADAPRAAKMAAAVSLGCWIGVIICGRLLTFYRPFECPPEGPGVIADCLPQRGQIK